ncbi:MAG: heme-binding protein, partial [Planctomycetales bacterium]|nr:heme-binding protein [Planctomycetales bacterium]
DSWTAAAKSSPDQREKVRVVGSMGDSPWGDVFSQAGGIASVKRDVFNLLPGFQVELLYTVPKDQQGSWVSIAFDDKGRLLASDQGDKGLYRITPPPIGSDEPTRVESLPVKITGSQGMLHAFGSLYVSVNGGPGSGIYRLKDTNGDDQYDEVTKLKSIRGGGEHGPHALRLSPDGKSIYWIAGNHTDPPENFDNSRVPKNWSEDLLLPRQWDANGHARGKLAPGGWIAKTDPEGKTWEIISSGYRNPYDMDFNADGELFAYDADMEWDMGTPWYRPTRVVHATSGSEFGWRSGTGKWPTWYVDSLPQLVNIGPGSPVGAEFGYGTRFPAKYQQALYICDWTFGTMYAIHIQPDGASYKATKEEFVSRTPLPLTDVAVGPDGALYFTVGGRGTQSELYRVTYVGKESTKAVDPKNEKFADLRALRHQIEKYHQPAADAAQAV